MTNPYGRQDPGSNNPYQYDPYGKSHAFPQNMPPAAAQPHPVPVAPVYGGMTTYRPTHSLATASLILSLAGFLCGISAIAGVITGHMARKRIRENPHYDGAGTALAGLIIGWITTGLIIAYVCVWITLIALAAAGSLN